MLAPVTLRLSLLANKMMVDIVDRVLALWTYSQVLLPLTTLTCVVPAK